MLSELKSLGIIEVSQQWVLAIKKASTIQSCIRKNVTSRLRQAIILLYSVLVRPYLVCCVQFLAPQYKRNMDIMD